MSTHRKRCLFAAALVLIAAACSGAPRAEQNDPSEVTGPLDPDAPPIRSVEDATDPEETRQMTEPVNRSGEGGGTVTPPRPEGPAPVPDVETGPGEALIEAPAGARVTRRPDGTCWVVEDPPDCPPGDECQPETTQVHCPDE